MEKKKDRIKKEGPRRIKGNTELQKGAKEYEKTPEGIPADKIAYFDPKMKKLGEQIVKFGGANQLKKQENKPKRALVQDENFEEPDLIDMF